MSGISYDAECPNCGKNIDLYSDYKPFDMIDGRCINCGFCIETKPSFLSLEELNVERKEAELEPLTKKEFSKLVEERDNYLLNFVNNN